MKRITTYLCTVALLLVFLSACSSKTKEKEGQNQDAKKTTAKDKVVQPAGNESANINTGNETKAVKANDTPDLLFFDIQLADGLSFEIFNQVQIQKPIIFTPC